MKDNFAKIIRRSIPSEEEMKAIRLKNIEEAKSNPTCFTHWFPTVEALGIVHPKSAVIDFDQDLADKLLDYNPSISDNPSMLSCVSAIRDFGKLNGYPLFLKNSLFSGKHDWKNTCFISESDSDNAIVEKIAQITHAAALCGVPRALYLIIREFIPSKVFFTAFFGEMPVTTEFRIFARDGKVEGWQPYWPAGSIQEPSDENWEELLKASQEISEQDLDLLFKESSRVTDSLTGYWSVDFLKGEDGKFYLIDMAEGDRSYKCPENYKHLA